MQAEKPQREVEFLHMNTLIWSLRTHHTHKSRVATISYRNFKCQAGTTVTNCICWKWFWARARGHQLIRMQHMLQQRAGTRLHSQLQGDNNPAHYRHCVFLACYSSWQLTSLLLQKLSSKWKANTHLRRWRNRILYIRLFLQFCFYLWSSSRYSEINWTCSVIISQTSQADLHNLHRHFLRVGSPSASLSPWSLHSHCGLWPLIWDHHPTANCWR